MTDADKYMENFYNGDPLEWKEKSNEVDEECVHCDGTGERPVSGFKDVNVSCSWCRGTGKMDKQEQQDLVQKDIEDQKRYRSYMYGSDDYIDDSDVPSDGFYESKANESSSEEIWDQLDETAREKAVSLMPEYRSADGMTHDTPLWSFRDSIINATAKELENDSPERWELLEEVLYELYDNVFESKASESIEEHYQEWKSSISSAWLDKTEDNWIAYAKSMIGYSEDEAKDQWEKWHYLTKPINESKANEVSAEEEEVAQDLWQALSEGGLLSDYIHGGIFKFDITYPDWVTDPEMDVGAIAWDELTSTDQQNVVNHFGGVDGMKERLCGEDWDQYCEDEDGYESKTKGVPKGIPSELLEQRHDEEIEASGHPENWTLSGKPRQIGAKGIKHDSLNFDPSYEAETSDAEYEDWSQNKTDEDTTRNNLEKLQEETVEESFGDCGCKMTNKAKETWEGLTDSDKQLELRGMGVDEGYAYYPFEHLPKKIGEAFVDKFNIEENGDSLGWNKITALERADTLRKIGFTPRDSELVSNLEYQQLSESLKKDVNEALNYKVKAQESQVPKDNSQEKFENGLYSNMYDGYLERRGARVDSKKKAKILENNNYGLDISKVKGVESKATELSPEAQCPKCGSYKTTLEGKSSLGYGKRRQYVCTNCYNVFQSEHSPKEIKAMYRDGTNPYDRNRYWGESKASEVSIDDFKRIVDRHQNETLQFDDGKVMVDAFTANAVVQVYNALSEEQKQTFNDVVKTSGGVSKVANLAFKHGESKANEDMKWWECEDCKFFGKTEDETNKHELETGHTTYGAGMTSAFPTFLKSKKTKSKEHNYLGGVPAKLKNTQCPECGSYDSLYEHETHGDLQCEVCGGAFEWEQVAEFNNVEVSDLGESKASEVISDSDKQILSDWVSQNRDWTTIDDLPNEIHYPLVAPFGDDIDKRVEAEVEIIDYMESLAESKANEERSDYKKMIADLNDPSKEVMPCPLCGKKSPYILMNDYWDKHFEAEHGYNIDEGEESKANEENPNHAEDGKFASGSGNDKDYPKIEEHPYGEEELFLCGKCKGSGEINGKECPRCGGTGAGGAKESKATERDFYRSNKEISDQGDDIQAEAEFGKKYSELSDSEKGYIEYIKNEFGDVKSYDEWVTSGEEGYQVKCDNCDGSGEDDGVCKQCNGKGYNEWGTYGTEAQVMGTPITNNDKFGREWGFSIINHGYGAGSETPYEVGIFLHDSIHKKNDVKGWLNEEEALYYKAKFEVDPIDTFRSIGGQMDSIINPDFVEQTEDNWNLWESLNTDGDRKRIRDWHGNTGTVDDDGNVVDDRTLIGSLEEASLSDPDNKKYDMDTDFGFSISDKEIEALDADTDVELSVDNEANQNRNEDGQFTSDLPEEKNEDYGRDPYSGKVSVPFVEAKESKSKAEEAFDNGASAEKIYSLVDDKGTDDDRSESEEEYLNNLYNKTNANKSTGFSDLQ